jgi:Fe2+ transport system protein FeoA
MEKRMSELGVGEGGKIRMLTTKGGMRRRFLDVGFSAGTEVKCIGKSPFGDPAAYLVRGCEIAIRKRDAESIILE